MSFILTADTQHELTHPLNALILSERVYYRGWRWQYFLPCYPHFCWQPQCAVLAPANSADWRHRAGVNDLLAWAFLGEEVSLTQITGSMPVLAGVLAISIKRSER